MAMSQSIKPNFHGFPCEHLRQSVGFIFGLILASGGGGNITRFVRRMGLFRLKRGRSNYCG